MVRKLLLVAVILLCSGIARAQGQGNTVMVFSGSAFSGACSGIMLGNDIVNGNLYFCAGPGYTWTAIGGSSVGGSFANLTSGTNTTAAMVVGTGASLAPTGTGTITATTANNVSSTINGVDQNLHWPGQIFVSGGYYGPTGDATGGGFILYDGGVYLVPFYVASTHTFIQEGIYVDTAGSSGCLLRFGIYNTSATTGLPSTVLLDAGTASCTSSSAVAAVTISQSLSPGLYWLAVAQQGAPATPATIDGGYNSTPYVVASSIVPYSHGDYIQYGITGALPTYTNGLSTGGFCPAIALEAQ